MNKTILTLIASIAICLSSFGQAPEGFKYQAVVRGAGNVILVNQTVGIQLTIQQGAIGGTTVYTETFAPTTNAYGLVNLEIGMGTTIDDFSAIDWANGPYFMETAVDVAGGTTYLVMGTNQLMSVPYALHAKTAEVALTDNVDDADNDPTNEVETWSTLAGIPVNIDTDATDDFDGQYSSLSGAPTNVSTFTNDAGYVTTSNDADNDPTNEIELPTGGTEGQVLAISSGVPAWVSESSAPISVVETDNVTRNIITNWTVGPTFTTISGFKAGSLVKLDYIVPSNSGEVVWGGLFIEPQISFDNGSTWNSLGSCGFDGGVMANSSLMIGSYTNSILVNPQQTADFSVTVRFFYKSFAGSTIINGNNSVNSISGSAPLMSGVNGTQHYTKVIVQEIFQ